MLTKNILRSPSMDNARIAIPSTLPGGLEAEVGAHFGHCEVYTIVDVQGGRTTQVSTLPNIPHQEGGCLAPVKHLAERGVTALIAGGMGLRPLMGFHQAGIEVFRGAGFPSVGEAVQALLKGELAQFSREATCGGGEHSCKGHQH